MKEARMKLSDFVVREAIITDLKATSKDAAIGELVRSLCLSGCFGEADREDITRAVLEREALGTTGVGGGVACPEARHHAIDRVIGTIALSRRGLEFGAMDGQPVGIVTLLLGAPHKPGEFLLAGQLLSRRLADEDFCHRLRMARTREKVFALVEEADRANP
jgi:mannitol/fructose-specific phosphotransferase system IIA component (Ntr-type)